MRPEPELYFHTIEQTAQRLTKEGLTDWKEVQAAVTECLSIERSSETLGYNNN